MNILIKTAILLLVFLTTKSIIIFTSYIIGFLLLLMGILLIQSEMKLNKINYSKLIMRTSTERP